MQPEARQAFRRLLDQRWQDALRQVFPEASALYTFSDYRRSRGSGTADCGLDHLLISPALAPRLADAGVDRNARGHEGASDHAPAWIGLDGTSIYRPP